MNGKCEDHDKCFDGIHAKLDAIIERLGGKDVDVATIMFRLKILELVVYGGIGIVLAFQIGVILNK